MTTLSTTEVSERLSTPVSTVKLWADRLRIGDRNSQGQRRFTEADVALMGIVRNLRDSDCGFETITRRLSSATVNDQQPTVNDHQRGLAPELTTVDVEAMEARITAAVVAATRADNELAEKYAHAAHRIGELEAENRLIREQADEARRLLTAGNDEANALRGEVSNLRAELAAERAKPLWRRLLGQ